MFKKLKIKIKKKEERKKKENSTELQKPNIEAEVYDNDKKYDWGEKKKLKSLIRFHSANKIHNYNVGEGGIQKNLQSKWKHKNNVFLESLLQESFSLLGVTVHLTHLDALQHCADLRTCCGGSSDSNLVLLLCVHASNVHSYQN